MYMPVSSREEGVDSRLSHAPLPIAERVPQMTPAAKAVPCQLLPSSLPSARVTAHASKPAIPFCITTLNAPDLERRFSAWHLINSVAEDQFFAFGPNAPRDFGGAPRAEHGLFGRIGAEVASRNGHHSAHPQLSGGIPTRLGIQDVKRLAVAQGNAPIADPWPQYGPLSANGVFVVCLREAGHCRTIRRCHEHALSGFEKCAWALSARSWSGRIRSWLDVAKR